MVTRANGGTLATAVDILRPETHLVRFINVIFAAQFTLYHSQASSYINLYQATAVPYTLNTPTVPVTPVSPPPNANSNDYPITSGNEGNYVVIITAASLTDTITFRTSSQTYGCPYDPTSFTDVRGIFTPCTTPTTLPAPPVAPTIPVIPADHIPVYGDSLNQFANMTDTQPRHDLGTLAIGDAFTFHIYFRLQTNLNPLTFQLQIVDGSFSALGAQPTGFGVDQTIGPNEPAHFTFTWTSTVAGQHYIEVFTTATTTTHPESLRIYELRSQKIPAGSTTTSTIF